MKTEESAANIIKKEKGNKADARLQRNDKKNVGTAPVPSAQDDCDQCRESNTMPNKIQGVELQSPTPCTLYR